MGKEKGQSSSLHIPKVTHMKQSFFVNIFSDFLYDCVLCFANIVLYIFFREVKVKGGFNVSKKCPVILVVAPHANQFVDGAVVLTQIRKLTNRNTASIIAESSYNKRFIGTLAKFTGSIPVPRAQDNLKFADGEIFIKGNDFSTIYGKGTKFRQFTPKGLLGLPQSGGNSVIEEIKNDVELVLRKPFKGQKAETLLSEGTRFKYAAKISNDDTFQHVFNHLHQNGMIDIFPEGGSHDRPDLLPIKAGVAIMALGAVATDPNCNLQVVPTGLNYFHRNEFRSRCVIEFGTPIKITKEMGEEYKKSPREAVSKLLDQITTALGAVTITAPDYDTLMVIQAVRRLYASKVPLSLVLEINRKLLIGYKHYKDHPRIAHLRDAVIEYNKKLDQLGLRDHQVEMAVRNRFLSFAILLSRTMRFLFLVTLSLPGTVLFAPIFIATDKYSKKKQAEALAASVVKIKAVDVIASWKITIATLVAPALYITYSIIGTYLTVRYDIFAYGSLNKLLLFVIIYLVLVLTTYSAFAIGETGVDILKSLPPLIASSFGSEKELINLKQTREKLALEITDVINTLGPTVFPDFDTFYKSSTISARSRDNLDPEHIEGTRLRSESASSSQSTSSISLTRVSSGGYSSDVPILAFPDSNNVSEAEYEDEVHHHQFEPIGNEDEYNEEVSLKLRKAMDSKRAGYRRDISK